MNDLFDCHSVGAEQPKVYIPHHSSSLFAHRRCLFGWLVFVCLFVKQDSNVKAEAGKEHWYDAPGRGKIGRKSWKALLPTSQRTHTIWSTCYLLKIWTLIKNVFHYNLCLLNLRIPLEAKSVKSVHMCDYCSALCKAIQSFPDNLIIR